MKNKTTPLLTKEYQKKTVTTLHRYSNTHNALSIQNIQAIQRKPSFRQSYQLTQNQKSVDQKIKLSFQCTTGVGTPRNIKTARTRQRTVDVSSDRCSNKSLNQLEDKSIQKKQNKKRMKGLSMKKMTSRDYHYNLNNKPCNDQRLFNNFQLNRPKTAHTNSFQKSKQRNLDFSHHHITHLEYDAQKKFEKYFYKNTPMSCRFNYRTQKKEGRIYFRSKQQFDNDIQADKLIKAFQASNNHQRVKDVYFYEGPGKQLPSSFQIMQMTPLKDFWHCQGVIPRSKLSYNFKKMRQDMREKRRSCLASKTTVHFQKGELCDTKYFLITGFGKQPLQID